MAARTISLCMTAGRDAARVRAVLEIVRPHVDEIVLAVDERASASLAACEDLVDVGLRYAFEAPPARYIGWIHHQCSGDWILRLDDDEVPSAALLAALPELVADRRPTHVALPWRHLFGTPDTWLTAHPWHPDYHVRLLQNVPGLWSFDGRVHHAAEVLGEQRRAPFPVYHLHYVIASLEERIERARAFERLDPGALTEAYAVNDMYVPERWEGLSTEDVPEEDRPLVAAVASPAPVPARSGAPARPLPPVTPVAEVDRFNMSRTVPADAYSAEVQIADRRRQVFAGTIAHLEVAVRNTGTERWPPAHQHAPLIRLASRWFSGDGTTELAEGFRVPFEETVTPGASSRAMLAVRVPDEPGTYVLEVDVVHEFVRWFDWPARATFTVEPLDGPSNGLPRIAPEQSPRDRLGQDGR